MPVFQYTATDQTGASSQGNFEAESEEQARSQLAQYGLKRYSACPAGQWPNRGQGGSGKNQKEKEGVDGLAIRRRSQQRRYLGLHPSNVDLGSGGSSSLEKFGGHDQAAEKKPKFKAMLENISEKVSSGGNLSDGLALYPKTFDNLFVNMVKAGEAGGVLELVLDRLAQFQEKSIRTIKKVKSAMIYPAVIMFVAVGIVTLLMMVVVPQFQSIFQQMLRGAPLPGPTQIIINISDAFSGHPVLVLGGMAGVVFGSIIFKKTKYGARTFDWMGLNIPAVRDVVSKSNISRITRTFGTLLSSGVPILQALQITRDTLTNGYFVRAMGNIHDSVRDGEAMAVQMNREKVFPSMVTSMVEIGEETGELPDMLTRIADNYDEDVDNAVASMTSLIEPVMIVLLALVVGFIVIALFLPIVGIIETIGK